MSEEAEALAAELSPSSGAAWAKLHDNLTSQITAKVELEGREQTLPMSAIRNLAMDPDRDLRRRAWQAELGAWEAHALPIAAALNGVKGQVLTLGARRNWADPLDESLFWSAIDRDILDVMVEEARAAFPDFRRYLRLKARLLGTHRTRLVRPVRPGWRCGASLDVAGSDRVHRGPVRCIQRPAERAGAARLRGQLDRRWAATGQGRRRVLHVAARGRIAHPRELLTGL